MFISAGSRAGRRRSAPATQTQALAAINNTKTMTPLAVEYRVGPDERCFAMLIAELKAALINVPNGIFDPLQSAANLGTTTNCDTSVAGKIKPIIYTAGSGTSTGMPGSTGGGFGGDIWCSTEWSIAANSYVTTVGLYSTSAITGLKFKMVQRIAAGNYNITYTETFNHAGGGFQDFTLTTPQITNATGLWYVGFFVPGAAPNINFSGAGRIHITGDVGVSNGNSGSEGANIFFTRATWSALTTNITVISNAFTATAAPSLARVIVQAKPVDAITINTDVIASVSRDGGTTFTAATLVAETTLADGTILYVQDGLDISAQPSGTSMKWKAVSANAKNFELNGAGLSWAT